MRYMQIDKSSISNGLGVRVVLWCVGCSQECKGYFNPETWSFETGKEFNEAAKKYLFEQLSKPYIKGLTLSGGHPLEKQNRSDIYFLLKEIKKQFPSKDIWLYTGYVWEDIENIREIQHILCYVDVLIDGPYIESQRDITLPFRGSTNQRIIDVRQSLEQNQVVLYNTKLLKGE